ncbi:FkbM family methyltransferase [Kiritimatiellota bacterium B12222]|nr:FkbM family methyltransferase [Kiritimatiellota bacterium B12222]
MILLMIHQNPFISAFIGVPEWAWKNNLRHWLATSPLVPHFIQDFSPIKGYELFRQLQPGDVVVDAGAFPGDYALFAAKRVGPQGHVYCLEPEAHNREILERNIQKSGYNNLSVIPKGLWDKTTTLQMDAHGLASQIQEEHPGDQSIEVMPLDQLVTDYNIPHIDVLKMDIEGAELEALAGAQHTLSTYKPYTCVASYHWVGDDNTSARVESLLKQAGLEVHTDYPKHLTTYGCTQKQF